ncbi:methyltransferase-like protein 24 [Lingula anatina]|uniref:Methyltransferase-like protein 24 n=1 Tax=Lingula anatina TaxID=7574 RepID=A0A1S3I390_LINAN|nr:methyltransferase-like protein 24 [Lingula anatina]|eukprot:XP_013392301.1 methyltransferase-like protein 24 [Lingula anatina]
MPAYVSNISNKSGSNYDAMERDFTRYLLKTQFDCRHRVRAGRSEFEDGGWEVCLDLPFNMVRGKCLVYSFGINNEWSFDDYMDKTLGCTVHAFDPSMAEKTDFSRSRNIRFHPIGIGGKNSLVLKKGQKAKWPLATLGTILKLYGHENKTLDYLKIDVEGAEWDSLPTMYREGVLARVKQLGIEVHWLPKEKDLKTVLELHKLGFRIYYGRRNYYSRKKSDVTGRTINDCIEVHFVNINFID